MAKTSKLNKLESEVETLWKEIKILSEQHTKQENLHNKLMSQVSILNAQIEKSQGQIII